MKFNGLVRVVSEQRRYNRIAYTDPIQYTYGPGIRAAAECTDVGLGGLGVRMGRYLRPGTLMLLTLAGPTDAEPLQMKARVTWCRGAGGHRFAAGLHVYHTEPAIAHALTELTAAASLSQHGGAELWSSPTPKVVMGSGLLVQ